MKGTYTKSVTGSCQAVLDYFPSANLIVKVNTLEEKAAMSGIKINSFVHAQHETAMLLVKQSMSGPVVP